MCGYLYVSVWNVYFLWKWNSFYLQYLLLHLDRYLAITYLLCKIHLLLISNEHTDLSVPQFVLVVVNIQRTQQFLGSLLVVNELSLRNGIRVQNTVSLTQIRMDTMFWMSVNKVWCHNSLTRLFSLLLVFVGNIQTSVWNLHRGSCWGNPFCRSWFLPAHRYSAAGASPGGSPWPLESWIHWGWCSVQSGGESTLSWSSACSGSPVRL